uniref:RRM domain-containing protein n=1 Tax=Panagrolaimus sp. ES5 TaxID=591445 RepID=A0AC34F594_9BILA
MATFAPSEMYFSQQQQQQQPPPQIRMAYPLDLSFANQMQYQGPASPYLQQIGEVQPSSPYLQQPGEIQSGSCESPCPGAASVINNRVFVGSLQIEVTEEIMKNVFEKVEPTLTIRDTKIVREQNGQSKGYGFVTYAAEEDAQKVINKPAGTVPSNYLCYPYSPSIYAVPNGMVGYLPQQVYTSPSPYITSPMMDQQQFVFPPPSQQ